MEKVFARLGLAVCALVIGATALLCAVRLIEGPRTLVHETHPCKPPKQDQTCTSDHYEGSWLKRPWLITGITLSICAGAIGLTLVSDLRERKLASSDVSA